MYLSEIVWDEGTWNNTRARADLADDCVIVQQDSGAYLINAMLRGWFEDLDACTAQAVLFHLFPNGTAYGAQRGRCRMKEYTVTIDATVTLKVFAKDREDAIAFVRRNNRKRFITKEYKKVTSARKSALTEPAHATPQAAAVTS